MSANATYSIYMSNYANIARVLEKRGALLDLIAKRPLGRDSISPKLRKYTEAASPYRGAAHKGQGNHACPGPASQW